MINHSMVEAGRYRVEAEGLVFEINKVDRGGWYITGIGDAADTLTKIHSIGGYGGLKGARRRIEELVETPAGKLFRKALALKDGEQAEFNVDGIEPDHLLRIVLALNDLKFLVHIKPETIAVKR